MRRIKVKKFDLTGSLFYSHTNGYIFYLYRVNDNDSVINRTITCVAALQYFKAELLIKDIKLFLKRNHWSYMEDGCNSQYQIDNYNTSDNDTICKLGDEFLMFLNEDVLVYPSKIPNQDKEEWTEFLMSSRTLSFGRELSF